MRKSEKKFRIFIPTRDSAGWIGILLDAYRRLGIEPVYVLDSRTVDRTPDILKQKGAEFLSFYPSGDYVEAGMIEFGARNIDADWLLRLDDDEFPTKSLMEWISRHAVKSIRPGWIISRRELINHNDSVYYSRRKSAYAHREFPEYLSGQYRLFRPKAVNFINRVHTTGLADTTCFGFAPQDCFFIHCVNLVKTPQQRLEKIRAYERIEKGSTWRVADEYLPEIFSEKHLNPARDGLDEFGQLINEIRILSDSAALSLTEEEETLARSETSRWVREIENYQRTYHVSMSPVNPCSNIEWLRFIPRSLWSTFAKFLCSVGTSKVRELGTTIWNLDKLLAR